MKVIVRKYLLGADGEETLHCAPALTFNGQSNVRAKGLAAISSGEA